MANELTIVNEFGEVLKTYEVPPGKRQFEGVCWEGVHLYGAQLGGAVFRDAELYWAGFFLAHLDGANFQNADLRGAVLTESSCVGTDFRGANLGKDNLGGCTELQGADLTAALLEGTNLKGAEYDANTKFPDGFEPNSHGMKETKV